MNPTTTTTTPDLVTGPSNDNPAVHRHDDPEALGALERLLDAELDYRPGARGGFISHLAMSLVAAVRLGATLGFRYSGGTVGLDGASGPVDVKFGGPQIIGGLRVGF